MLDIDQLLQPVSDDAPCGEDLSFSTEFDTIAEARRADDPTLEQGEWQTDLKTADWDVVLKLTGKLLHERSKDIRLAVWMTEALVQTDGFAGLARGYRLLAALCDRYWEHLLPSEEGEDGSLCVGHLRWLLKRSPDWVRALPITRASEGQYTANDFQVAHARAGTEAEREDNDYPSLEALDAARRATPFEFYSELATLAPDCMTALAELETVVDAKAGDDSPSFRACRESIERVSDMVQRFARDAGVHVEGDAPPVDTAQDAADESGDSTPTRKIAGEINTRREALAQLRQVAAFFRRTEPHSPVAYLADKAAKWGEMPLHVWLQRVIKDDNTLSRMQEMLDVEVSSGANDDED